MMPRLPLSLLAMSVAVTTGFAADNDEDRVSGRTESDSSPVVVSHRLSSAILSNLPAYEKPKPKEETAEDEDVVVMKEVTVRERRQPRVKGWEMLSERGMEAYLKERYRGAAVPGDPLTDLVHNYAKLMNAEEIRLEHLKAIQDSLDTRRAAGTTEDWKALNRLVQGAKMRPNDWKAESMDRSANNDRR